MYINASLKEIIRYIWENGIRIIPKVNGAIFIYELNIYSIIAPLTKLQIKKYRLYTPGEKGRFNTLGTLLPIFVGKLGSAGAFKQRISWN